MREPAVVGTPSVQKMSLTAIGATQGRSTAIAASFSPSARHRYAFSSTSAVASVHASPYSTAESSPAHIARWASRAVIARRSVISPRPVERELEKLRQPDQVPGPAPHPEASFREADR